MEIITEKRFLVRSLFDGERTCQLMLVDLTGPVLKVLPFDVETPSTVFIDARVVLLGCRLAEIPDLESSLSCLGAGNQKGNALMPFLAYPGITESAVVSAVAY